MKYMKLSSLLVLSLLVLAPSAWADVECELRPDSQQLRMEGQHEMLEALTIRCEVDGTGALNALGTESDPGGGLDLTATRGGTAAAKARSTFNLELQFPGEISNDDAMPITLWLKDHTGERKAGYEAVSGADQEPDEIATADEDPTDIRLTATNKGGNRIPAPEGVVVRNSVSWDGIPFPDTWTTSRGSFTIAGIYIDATSVDDDRLEVTVDMVDNNDLLNDNVVTTDSGPVSVARVDQALDLSFAEDNKANDKINACTPGKFAITVTLEEGFKDAWNNANDILLMVSSGKISAKDSADKDPFDVTAEGGTGELIIGVMVDNSDNSEDLAITFEPAAGNVGDDLILSAELLPEKVRGTSESFVVSAKLDVGTYVSCTGDTLVFPFLSNMSGFDTGVALINNSDVDGECVLSWDGKVEKEYEDVDERDKMDVDAKGQTVFILSMANPGFQGLLSVQCEFGAAYGYAFITDTVSGSGAQGYVAR